MASKDSHRAIGSFSVIRRTRLATRDGIPGRRTIRDGNGSSMCIRAISRGVRAINGSRPVSIRYAVMPRA